MATNSIYNSIRVTDRRYARSLVKVLEDTSKIKDRPIKYSRPVHKMTKEEIEKVFRD